jgi:hypothetical protein
VTGPRPYSVAADYCPHRNRDALPPPGPPNSTIRSGAFDPEVPPLAAAALESLQTKRATRTAPARSS